MCQDNVRRIAKFIAGVKDRLSYFVSGLGATRSALVSEIDVERGRFATLIGEKRAALVEDIESHAEELNSVADAAREALRIFAANQPDDIDFEAAIVAAIGNAEATFYSE